MFTFYAGVASVSMTLFKCSPNPNTLRTLSADRGLICYEPTWQTMLIVAILAVTIWCAGYIAVIVYGFWTIPSHFHKEEIQSRWKFMLLKFRPDVHWWALVFVV